MRAVTVHHRNLHAFAIAVLAIAIALLDVPAARAARAHGRRAEPEREAVSAAALAQIHVLGGRPAPFALDARAAMLVDARTGAVLYGFNEHARTQPASLAKIMTFYLTLDALKGGRLALDTPVVVSEKAWRLSMDQEVSRMFLGVGQRVAARDLLYGLMVSSGNDAAVALAEYLGGSIEAFTDQMNAKAKEIGLDETRFANPDGLPVEGEYTTAADMVKLGRALLAEHPEALTYTGAKEFTFDKIRQRNFNTLLFYDSRVNGIKTGHVEEAGFHLVASAESNGMRLISAVMGTPNAEKRRLETEKLLDWAFRTFVAVKPDWRAQVPPAMPVYGGVADTVAIAPARDAYVTVGRGEEKRVSVAFAPAAKYLTAPVATGAQAGELTVTLDGKPQESIPVVTQSAVARGSLFKRIADRIRRAL
ncbi:MAG TPA: D-alanyl-D-alanine carboxypeptidase family protein [Candidatus Binataceae bacterium]|nr:D-alanyl-D-alanine carboxypeptidase family protein [Candidatus Binataceae bacterium]